MAEESSNFEITELDKESESVKASFDTQTRFMSGNPDKESNSTHQRLDAFTANYNKSREVFGF